MQPWERLRALRSYLRSKRDDGFYIFSGNHIDNTEMMEAFHDQHLASLGRAANLEEKAANKQYRGRK
jgi:hypothetical protein